MRPTKLEDIVGQDPGRTTSWPRTPPLGPRGRPAARQLHHPAGPPGVGKTTVTRLLADGSDMVFLPVSGTFSGVADHSRVFGKWVDLP